jgi:hypothetical protein
MEASSGSGIDGHEGGINRIPHEVVRPSTTSTGARSSRIEPFSIHQANRNQKSKQPSVAILVTTPGEKHENRNGSIDQRSIPRGSSDLGSFAHPWDHHLALRQRTAQQQAEAQVAA